MGNVTLVSNVSYFNGLAFDLQRVPAVSLQDIVQVSLSCNLPLGFFSYLWWCFSEKLFHLYVISLHCHLHLQVTRLTSCSIKASCFLCSSGSRVNSLSFRRSISGQVSFSILIWCSWECRKYFGFKLHLAELCAPGYISNVSSYLGFLSFRAGCFQINHFHSSMWELVLDALHVVKTGPERAEENKPV